MSHESIVPNEIRQLMLKVEELTLAISNLDSVLLALKRELFELHQAEGGIPFSAALCDRIDAAIAAAKARSEKEGE